MSPHVPNPDSADLYWDQMVAEQWSSGGSQRLWRRHSDAVNCDLFEQWLPDQSVASLLKTDLFDEACGVGLFPVLKSGARRVFGLDVSKEAIREATQRHPELTAVQADVRRLPFSDGQFDVIVSNSTLDHFRSIDELVLSLDELSRGLRQGGQLLLTMDNPANPIIALRNRLPFHALNRLGILPYYVGATCGPRRLQRLVTEAGLSVQETRAIMHCPRVLAVAASRWIDRFSSDSGKESWLRWLKIFEHLGKLPTRFVSGYFIALRVTKL